MVYEWCASSIPAGKLCPSNVDKSTQPWPLPSSFHTSTLLISNTNNDNNPINTDIISLSSSFYSKEKDKVTHVLSSSSLDYPYDYYTNKRIEQLHDRMDDIQISSFLKFINYHLSTKNKEKFVKDLSKDLSNGHILIDLIEIFSSTKLKREYGQTRFHSLTNVQYVLDYLKLHMQHINISPHEIVSGNRKQILALLWMIMKIFDFPSFRITTNKHLFNENTLFSFGQDRSILIKWINNLLNKIFNTNLIYIKDFYLQTWLNKNSYLILIIKYLCPLSSKYGTLEYFDYLKQLDEFNSNNQQCLELCLNFSNYFFNTISIIDYTDRTEKNLFRFFSELQQNILFILKSNQIGKLTKTNPYTKQLLDTLTIIEHSKIMNDDDDDEDYLIFTEEESGSYNNELLKPNIMLIEESEHTRIKTENLEESVINMEISTLLDDVINIIQDQQQQQHCSPSETLSSINDDSVQNLRPRKNKKKRSTMSIEKLTSISSTPNSDLFVKIIEFLRDPKMIRFKYVLILVCLCFSILIIFIHK